MIVNTQNLTENIANQYLTWNQQEKSLKIYLEMNRCIDTTEWKGMPVIHIDKVFRASMNNDEIYFEVFVWDKNMSINFNKYTTKIGK